MDRKRILIFGVTGQDGSFLAEQCLKDRCEVYGVIRRTSTNNLQNLEQIKGDYKLELLEGDLCDSISIEKAINSVKPHEIYNLAAQSHVQTSFDQPEYTTNVNYLGVLRILEAIRKSTFQNIRFYQAGTSEQFGNIGEEVAIYEKSPMNPVSPYAIAKYSAYQAVKIYREAYNMFACVGLLFNHESERRGENFVTMKICNGFKKIMAVMNHNADIGKKAIYPGIYNIPKIKLGNLEAKRDWGYAPDYTKAMRLMLQQNEPDDYVEIDPKFYRPVDVNVLCADPSKAFEILGWGPETSFHNMVRKMLGVMTFAQKIMDVKLPTPEELIDCQPMTKPISDDIFEVKYNSEYKITYDYGDSREEND